MMLCLAGWLLCIWSLTTPGAGLCLVFSYTLSLCTVSLQGSSGMWLPAALLGQKLPPIKKPAESLWPKHCFWTLRVLQPLQLEVPFQLSALASPMPSGAKLLRSTVSSISRWQPQEAVRQIKETMSWVSKEMWWNGQ